jgi:hypothetical protein
MTEAEATSVVEADIPADLKAALGRLSIDVQPTLARQHIGQFKHRVPAVRVRLLLDGEEISSSECVLDL